ncbi:MAG: hypothetical protein AAGK02_00180 [Pseudomonadota bacterium]
MNKAGVWYSIIFKSIFLMGAFFIIGTVNSYSEESKIVYPRIGGGIIFRMAHDNDYRVGGSGVEATDVSLRMEARPNLQLSERLRIDSEIRLEGARPATDNRFFDEQALFVRKLFAEFDVTDDLSVHAGKTTPSFAFFSLRVPGMYGNEYSREIELIERVSLGADYTFDFADAGEHKLSATSFYQDTTILSDSLFASRGQTNLTDGGASNTESFESVAIALEGTKIPALPDFTYKLAYLHEARGNGDVADENGFLFGAIQSVDLKEYGKLDLLGEFAYLSNFEGSADDIMYVSGASTYSFGPWRGVLSGTYRPRNTAEGENFNDYQVQTAISYSFTKDLSLEVAHEFTRDQNENANRIGLRLNLNVDLEQLNEIF